MEISLNGIPISEDQCIGDSLDYINGAFLTLKTTIAQIYADNQTTYLKSADFKGFYPNTGGIVSGGVNIGGTEINNAAKLTFGRTVSASDMPFLERYPTIYCGSSSSNLESLSGNGIPGIGYDLFVNAKSPNAKIFFRTYNNVNALVLNPDGTANFGTNKGVVVGLDGAAATERFEVFGGNVKVNSDASPALILNNITSNSSYWNSRVVFASNLGNLTELSKIKYQVGVEGGANSGLNEFYIRDGAGSNKLSIKTDGKVYIANNVGIGIDPVANYGLKLAGSLYVGGGLDLAGAFSTNGINSLADMNAVGVVRGNSATFVTKVTAGNLDVGYAITGGVGTFSGKLTATNNIETAATIIGANGTFVSNLTAATLGIASTGIFGGKVTTINLESTGPVTGVSGSFGSITVSSNTVSDKIIANTGNFSTLLTAANYFGSNAKLANIAESRMLSAGDRIIIGDDTIIVSDTIRTTYTNVSRTLSAGRCLVETTLTASDVFAVNGVITDQVQIDSYLQNDGGTNLTNNLTVSGTSAFKGIATFKNDVTVAGNLSCVGDVIAFSTSDRNLKTNAVVISDALTKLGNVNGYTFEWNTEATKLQPHLTGKTVGVFAQEVEEVLPEAVTIKPNGYKAVNYELIVPLLIQAVKELRAEVDFLKSKS